MPPDYSDVLGQAVSSVMAAVTMFWFCQRVTTHISQPLASPAEPGQDILAQGAAGSGNPTETVSPGLLRLPMTHLWACRDLYDTGLADATGDTALMCNSTCSHFVHNEFHGELTAPPGHLSKYCTITQAFFTGRQRVQLLEHGRCRLHRWGDAISNLIRSAGLGLMPDYNAPPCSPLRTPICSPPTTVATIPD